MPDYHSTVVRIALNRNQDEVNYVFRGLATWLVSPHWDVFVKAEAYIKLLTGKDNEQKLTAFAVLNPSIIDGFATVTIMGALFTNTPLYLIWSQLDIDFQPHERITASRIPQHANGPLISFRYMLPRNLSKKLNNKYGVVKQMARAVVGDVASGHLLWMANKGQPDTLFQHAQGQQTRLPNTPHGLNVYQNIHAVAVVSALNYSPGHGKFLEGLGFDKTALKRAVALQTIYQAMMRSSIRDPKDTNPKKVYVFDKQIADWLQEKFPDSTVTQLPGITNSPVKKLGRPKGPQKTEKEKLADLSRRVRKSREKKAQNSR